MKVNLLNQLSSRHELTNPVNVKENYVNPLEQFVEEQPIKDTKKQLYNPCCDYSYWVALKSLFLLSIDSYQWIKKNVIRDTMKHSYKRLSNNKIPHIMA